MAGGVAIEIGSIENYTLNREQRRRLPKLPAAPSRRDAERRKIRRQIARRSRARNR